MKPEEAYLHSSKHRDEILASKLCGCFHCLHVFGPSEIHRWTDQRNTVGQTAFCPACAIDVVIGDRGVPITANFLEEMRARYFGVPVPSDVERVWTAIREVGMASVVDIEFRSVEVDTSDITAVRIELDIHFRRDRRVCCGEPGCYTPFLGARRGVLPAAIRAALHLPEIPQVEITARLLHEPGFSYASIGTAIDQAIIYPPDHFRESR
jgi:hypothetical protein